ncbi:uncharacterized protein N7482_009064 [Penicillium canariense]|uniref:Carrier domain-containing protein n=1 Tax=Penicillium canariense TaxID=189055 RepID=A0A9W9LED0_9EURO|nr:uncharacterized protein N7482_009064 [Penicillium canariense]KAJ5152586.1 hypothetical protein N7482_009064 [Penicillium canariense]
MSGKREPEPIAIVGMGCRWAGGVRDTSSLWEFLINKRSGYHDWAEPRFSAKGFYHPNPERPGTTAAKGGYTVTEDPRLFDPSFFGISGLEAETIDASQRKLLEVVYEAFESAGDTWESINGTRMGVYVADISYDNSYAQTRDWEYARPHATTGVCHNILSNRINYVFNLHGPSVTLDSACTSALYGLHMAMQAIRDGDCDSAIVATANWIMDPAMQIAMDKLGALSGTSMSHAFDASADGYARGEGFAAIYLKKPEKAMKDGSPMRALVRGSAIGANGRSSGITHPSGSAQEAIIRKAYENTGGLDPSQTPFLECHGTGTRVGDPLEVEAAGKVFGPGRSDAPEDRLLIGSVKTNLGHTEGAAALAGIFKAVLALEAGVIPPSIGVKTLNPRIDFEKAKAEVVTEVIPWPEGKLRRASVTSAGFGGSIGHCVLDHVNILYPDYVKPGILGTATLSGSSSNHSVANGNVATHTNGHANVHANGHTNCHANGNSNGISATKHVAISQQPHIKAAADADTRQMVLLPFAAHKDASLKLNIEALFSVIDQHSLADVAYTLGARRSKLSQRTFRVVNKDDAAQGLLNDIQKTFTAAPETPRLGFVFTGQGAQWPAMGAELFEYRIFRTSIEYLDNILSAVAGSRSWTIAEVLSGKSEPSLVQTPEVSQTVCTAVQIGLVNLLVSWSVYPSGVVGHSSGEMAAAYAAGRISAAESITAAYFRGQAVSLNKQRGAMLAVGMSLEQAAGYLEGIEQNVKVAAINSYDSLTLSGEQDAVERLSATLNEEGVFNRLLKTGGNAYHSHHMVALGQEYETLLSEGLDRLQSLGLLDEQDRYPCISWASSVTPHKDIDADSVLAAYWRSNLESPVRFADAVTNLVQDEGLNIGALVEIGPHPALKGPVNQVLKSLGKTIPYTGSLTRGEDSRRSILQLAGSLFGMNAQISLAAVNATDGTSHGKPVLTHGTMAVDLPPYQYGYGPVSYYESRASKEFRLRSVQRHDLVGSKVAGNAKLRPQFRNVLRMKDLPWLGDHRLIPDVVLPAAGYMCMAMVAASQLYEELPNALPIAGFSLRNVDIKTALKIPEDQHGVEVMLSLELASGSTVQAPSWTSFSVSSVVRDSEQWTEHCTGQVKLDVSDVVQASKLCLGTESRAVDSRAWYKTFASIGLGYGPAFQALSAIRAVPTDNLASANLNLKTTAGMVRGGESVYPIHPASLDAMIQLGLLACHGGQIDQATTAFVPIHLSQLYLRTGNDQGWGTAVAHGELRGLRSAYLQLQLQSQAGDLLLDIKDLRCISFMLDDRSPAQGHSKAYASPFMRMVYKPDFRAFSSRQARGLFPPPTENASWVPILASLESIAAFIAVDVYDTLISVVSAETDTSRTLGHYLAWLKRLVDESGSPRILEVKALTPAQRSQVLGELYEETSDVLEAKALRRLHESMSDILQGKKTGEEVLALDGLLTDLLEDSLFLTGAYPQITRLVDSIGHADPNTKILELEGGRGRVAGLVLEALSSTNGIKCYQDYTVTDKSEAALQRAQGQLASYQDVDFSVLDIRKDPLDQGFEPVYDVVLASQVIHTASSVIPALKNVRKLLKPGGKLILAEVTGNSAWVGLIGGAQAGYWHGAGDGRLDGPFLDITGWDRSLRSAGFSGIDVSLDDYPSPTTHSNVLVSTRIIPDASPSSGEVWLLHGKRAPDLLKQLASELDSRNLVTKTLPLDSVLTNLPAEARVIAFLDDENLLLDTSELTLDIFKYLAHNTASMVWLTSTGMAQGHNPDGAVVVGLLRTISTEAPTGRFFSVDIDADHFDVGELDTNELIRALADKEQGLQQPNYDQSEDREFAWHSGCLWMSRLVPEAALHGYAERSQTPATHGAQLLPLDSQGPVRAAFETPGMLSSLYFKPYTELAQPLPRNSIEVKVAGVGLNWKDLALSTGRFDMNNLSSEYSGVITSVGADAASRFAVGNLVYGLGEGHFGNYTRVPGALAQKARDGDDLLGVATMPVVFMTAIYAFEHLTRLRRGQKVLIHSASGGVGLGAIQLAQAKGADVYAMAGTPEKVRFLVEEVGLPSSHVLTREPEELARATVATGGFDVVLSTAQGNGLYDSINALAPLGHLIDLGRVDVNSARAIGLELFQKSASFSSFDLARLVRRDLGLGAELMQAVDEHYRAGHIRPIHPMAVSDISQLDQTLLGFSKGTHVGKLVVSFQDPHTLVRMVPASPAARFDPEACYVVTGGLSGLGRSIIQWMGSRGAQEIVVLSRRGPHAPDAQTLVNALAKRGVRVHPVACDLSSSEQVVRAIKEASSILPVKGIVHCAVSYQDISFHKISLEGWRDGLAAKVRGTWNLHEATKALPLDFFVMTTSILSVLSFATQGAYTAANNFQDQFARYRRRQGLPATAAQFGLVNDVGHLSTDPLTLDLMTRNKVLTVSERYFLRLLEPAFLGDVSSQFTSAAVDPLAAATYVTYMDPAHMAQKERENTEIGIRSVAQPRWYNDARVSHVIRGFDDAMRHNGGDENSGSAGGLEGERSTTARNRREFDDAVGKTRTASDGNEKLELRALALQLTTSLIATTVATMLLMDLSAVNTARAVSDHGVDSLIAAELRNWFHLALGSKISMVDLLDPRTSINALAAKVVDAAVDFQG